MNRIIFVFLLFISYKNPAQQIPFILKGALKENRQQLYRNLVNNAITKNLSLPLNDSTAINWEDAFAAMEFIHYRSAWVDSKVYAAFGNKISNKDDFNRVLLELVYTLYPDIFLEPVKSLLTETKDVKTFALCAEYIMLCKQHTNEKKFLEQKTKEKLSADPGNPVLQQLSYNIQHMDAVFIKPGLKTLFDRNFLPGNVLMFSLQRKNRNYPGIVIIRDGAGNFLMENDHLFSVSQLAKSLSGLPGYLTNGNTPEGIFRMDRFDTSQSNFIGPTTNIQLTMPFEYKASHFYKDSTLADSIWNLKDYKNLLPGNLQDYYPLYQSFYAGAAGRTEIIAHGTTVDPSYYKNKTYYPFTPTLGCLCCKELWNDETGRLIESDQQKLTDAISKAGGPYGYAIVINIDDQQKDVEPAEIMEFIKDPNQK